MYIRKMLRKLFSFCDKKERSVKEAELSVCIKAEDLEAVQHSCKKTSADDSNKRYCVLIQCYVPTVDSGMSILELKGSVLKTLKDNNLNYLTVCNEDTAETSRYIKLKGMEVQEAPDLLSAEDIIKSRIEASLKRVFISKVKATLCLEFLTDLIN